ncbi:MAG: hypothetical protein U9N73_05070 [Candidatus Auribacterota bacterium]|nr:hypothetical protein [Candidatus Auribacterota bacterium]
MDPHIFFIIGGVAFVLFLLVALDLTRLIKKKSGDWQELATEEENETKPLMEVGNVDEVEYGEEETPPRKSEEITKLNLPQRAEIFDHILTHTDWDGIISGALLKHFSPLAKVEVTSARGVRWALRTLAKNPDKPHRLFITDVGISSESLADIEDALIDLQKAGVKIYWYDHHPWSNLSIDTAERDCADIIVDPKFRNAADIVFKRINGEDDSYASQLMRLINNKLNPEEVEWGKNWRLLILSTQSAPSRGDIVDLIAKLAGDKTLSVSDKFKIKRMAEEEVVYKKFAEGKHREEVTQSGMKFLVVDLRVFREEYDESGHLKRKFARHNPPASIGYDIVQYHNPDFYIMVLKNDRLSIRGGVDRKFKVDTLKDLRSIKGNPCRISGHSYAAGVYLTVGIGSKLKYIYNWALPLEVEDFIEEIKARL